MRFSVGGCVEKSAKSAWPENGWMMNMWAVAGLASSGTRRATASILRSARTRPSGDPTSSFAPASAANSRDREIAACTLLDRPYRRLVDDLPLRYVGFTVPDHYFVGYGFDLDGRWRQYALGGTNGNPVVAGKVR